MRSALVRPRPHGPRRTSAATTSQRPADSATAANTLRCAAQDEDDDDAPDAVVVRAAVGGAEGSGQRLPAAYGTISAQAPSTLKLRTKVNKEDAAFKAR